MGWGKVIMPDHPATQDEPSRILRFELPVPISLNNAYANRSGGGGRYPTKAHKDWKTEAGWELQAKKPGRIEGPYRLTLLLAQNLRGDISNRIKLLEDLLVEYRITPDDKHAQHVTAQRSIQVLPGRCLVILEAA